MSQAAHIIRDRLRHMHFCSLDDLIRTCPTVGWNEIFCELDQMSRSGSLLLSNQGHGRCGIRPVEASTGAYAEPEALSHSPTITQEEGS